MKYLYAILLIDIALLCWAHAGELPPLPPHDPTPAQLVALGDIPAAIVVDPTKPTERKEVKAGQIIRWDAVSIEWEELKPLYRVQWKENLTEGEWKTVGIRSGDTLTHGNAAGFYRVVIISRPTPPPTYPPKQTPILPEIPRSYTTNVYARGFR